MDVKHCIDHIHSLNRAHILQRYQLELGLDDIARDSRYSNTLIEYMKKEEQFTREGNIHSNISIDTTKKVEILLKQETKAFFHGVTQHNLKKWIALLQKFDKERAKVKDYVINRVKDTNTNNISATSTAPLTPRLTKKMLFDEELRLEEDYNENWLKYEKFSLDEAFKSQLARIDNDWSAHEIEANKDYQLKCNKLGVHATCLQVSNNTASASSQIHKWQNAEKQKTLIHTAPVMKPSLENLSISNVHHPSKQQSPRSKKNGNHNFERFLNSQGTGNHLQNEQILAEAQNIDVQYQAVCKHLKIQKCNAIRWMRRQQIRLVAQSEELDVERRAIASLMKRERNEFSNLKQLISEHFEP